MIRRTWFDDGRIRSEHFYDENGKYRSDGPAKIFYHLNTHETTIAFEIWMAGNQYHRLDGPAYIEYNEKGKIVKESYYIKNEYFSKGAFYRSESVLKYNINQIIKRELET